MYRNAYLDVYKNSIANNGKGNIQQLIIHFTQIYATLGSVLQDLQFQVGVIIYSQSKKEGNQTNKNNLNSKLQFQDNKKETFQNANKLVTNYQQADKKRVSTFGINENSHFNNNDTLKQKFKEPQLQIQSYNNPISTQQFQALFMSSIPTKQTIQKQNKQTQKQRYSNHNRKSNKQVDYLDQILNKAKK